MEPPFSLVEESQHQKHERLIRILQQAQELLDTDPIRIGIVVRRDSPLWENALRMYHEAALLRVVRTARDQKGGW